MMERDVSPLAQLHEQLALERKGVDSSGRLFRLPGENPDEIGLVQAIRLSDGKCVAYFRDDLPEAVVAALRDLTPEQVYHEQARVRGILGANGSGGRWRTYFFSSSPRPEEYVLAVERDDRFLIEVDGVVGL